MRTSLLLLIITVSMSACSKQSWYQSVQSANTSQCMKAPTSEYEDCNKQYDKSYQEYETDKKQLENKKSTEY